MRSELYPTVGVVLLLIAVVSDAKFKGPLIDDDGPRTRNKAAGAYRVVLAITSARDSTALAR